MDDLISRQAAIDEVQRHRENVLGGYEYDEGVAFVYAAAHNHIIEVIKCIPSAQQWIPCSERLPEEYVSVLCYQPILYESNIWIGYLNSDRIWVDSDGWEKLTNPVTAWMPLPGPYEDKHED